MIDMSRWNIFDNFLLQRRIYEALVYIPSNAIVCDIGCGDGKLLFSIKNKIREGIGIDKKIKEGKYDNLLFIKQDIDGYKLEINSEYVDVVLLLAVLEHLRNPKNTLKEIYRILKPGGILILTTPSPWSKIPLELMASISILNKNQIYDHKHYYSKNELIELLKNVGFSEISFSYFQLGFNQKIISKK